MFGALWGLSYYDENCRPWIRQPDGSLKTTGLIFDQQKFPDGRLITTGPWENSRKIEYPNGEYDEYTIRHGTPIHTTHYSESTGKQTFPIWPEEK